MTDLEFALDIGIYRIILEGDFEILIKALKTGCGSLAQSGLSQMIYTTLTVKNI